MKIADINYCYKIVLAGMTEQRSRAEESVKYFV